MTHRHVVYDDEDDEDEPVPPSIVRFVPEDKTTCKPLLRGLQLGCDIFMHFNKILKFVDA